MNTIRAACLMTFLLISALAHAQQPTEANHVREWSFTAAKAYADPFNEVELDAVFTTPDGKQVRIPAFWAGGQTWKLRYASSVVGKHAFRTICSDRMSNLHAVEGFVEITAYTGENPLYRHGPIRVAFDKRHFEHADGTPFFWLGDTWWMGLCDRLRWPEDFKTLAADRKKKGFNVIQIVAGLYPDMHPFDPRGANEAGFPWDQEYQRINPAYFDAADERLQYLADEGFSPCIVGAWGYFIPSMGVEKAKQHWRYLIARYGALPVTWCAAGEANLPWYLAKGFPYDDRRQVTDWTAVTRSIRETDGFDRPLTIHPTGLGRLSARHATDDESLLDFDMLQTPHGQREAVEPTVRTVRESYADPPVMPVINGEAAYEMLGDTLPTEWTRQMFWLCMTNGAAGHTYGANGIWQVNRRGQPHGPSPHHAPGSAGYGTIPWDEAMNLPGSTQIAAGAKLFQRFAWQKFKPHPEWAAYEQAPNEESIRWGDWIWFPEGEPAVDAPIAKRRFRKTFEVPAGAVVERAVVHLAVDNALVAALNGERIGSHGDLNVPIRFDIAAHIQSGTNVLEIEAENVWSDVPNNPAGLLCAGVVTLADGTEIALASGPTWTASRPDKDRAWNPAKVVATYGQGPWGEVGLGQQRPTPPQACGIPGQLRLIYVPVQKPVRVVGLEREVPWQGEFFNPVTGETTPLPKLAIGEGGAAVIQPPPVGHDWVVVLRRLDQD
ncbi:MAG TPA: DUF4038 domain-containing protein [Tepidisphaeraceae bacterium]|nr:DUF4038 domain-containing protein [Tepidisphaeraceae bacterium]